MSDLFEHPETQSRPRRRQPPKVNGIEAPDNHPVASVTPAIADVETLDEEEIELRNMRIDLRGGGPTGAGLTAISVAKTPGKESFFRTHPEHVLDTQLVTSARGLDISFLAVAPVMVNAMIAIAYPPQPHRLYLTITREGILRFVPVRLPDDGDWNVWQESKELALLQARKTWVRLSTNMSEGRYQSFPLEENFYPDPVWPTPNLARLFRLAFRDRGRLIDSPQHPYYLKLIGREPQPR
jgi:hypothetical protein